MFETKNMCNSLGCLNKMGLTSANFSMFSEKFISLYTHFNFILEKVPWEACIPLANALSVPK